MIEAHELTERWIGDLVPGRAAGFAGKGGVRARCASRLRWTRRRS